MLSTAVLRAAGVHAALLALLAAVVSVAALAADAGMATLPQAGVDTYVSADGAVLTVPGGGDLQAALMQAQPGDTIELEAGAVFRGPFLLPDKAGDQWITLRSSTGAVPLPPAGQRVTPAAAPAMARLESAAGAVVEVAAGAHHYRFVGIEFAPASGVFLPALVVLGAAVSTVAEMPHHFLFERCYLHGDAMAGTRRGIVMNSASTAVHDSWLADFKMRGDDSQAIIGWGGSGPYSIVNNHLEAAGENLMFGGGDPLIALLVPADIEIRRNHLAKPLSWKAGERGYADTGWTVKNLLELKNARRVLIEGNVFEYNWTQSQNGYAILFTVRNQQGMAPWSVVEDITFASNIVRHVANGINVLGTDDNFPSGPARRISIRNNLFDDVGGRWGEGNLLQLLDGVEAFSMLNNTALNSAKILMSEGRAHGNLVFRANIVRHNEYGVIGTGTGSGNATLARYFPAADLRNNVIIGGPAAVYPPGNAFPSTLAKVGFVDAAGGDYRLTADSRYRASGAGIAEAELCAALSPVDAPPFCLALVP